MTPHVGSTLRRVLAATSDDQGFVGLSVVFCGLGVLALAHRRKVIAAMLILVPEGDATRRGFEILTFGFLILWTVTAGVFAVVGVGYLLIG
jgi:hypothetical protein